MNHQQKIALKYHCRLACETIHPRFGVVYKTYSLVLSVNSGYE